MLDDDVKSSISEARLALGLAEREGLIESGAISASGDLERLLQEAKLSQDELRTLLASARQLVRQLERQVSNSSGEKSASEFLPISDHDDDEYQVVQGPELSDDWKPGWERFLDIAVMPAWKKLKYVFLALLAVLVVLGLAYLARNDVTGL